MASRLSAISAGSVDITVYQAFNGFGVAFGYLFQGDLGGFLDALLMGPAYLVATFLILYGLMLFVGRISIFRSEEHKKYAQFFAVGIAIIGTISGPIFNLITQLLSGTFLLIILILFIIYAIMIFVKHLRTAHAKSSTDLRTEMTNFHRAEAEMEAARRDEKKVEHDNRLSDKMEKREEDALDDVDNDLKKDWAVKGKVQDMFTKYREWLHQLMALDPNSEPARSIRQRLLAQSAAFTGLLKKEELDASEIKHIIERLEVLVNEEGKIELDERRYLDHINDQIHQSYKDLPAKDQKDVDIDKRILEVEGLIIRIQQAHQKLHDREKELLRRAELIDGQELTDVRHLEAEMVTLTEALHDGDSRAALNALNSMESMHSKITKEETEIKYIVDEFKKIERQVNTLTNREKKLIREALKLEKKEEEHEEEEEHDAKKRTKKGKATVLQPKDAKPHGDQHLG